MEALSLGIVEELPQVATTSPVPMPAAGHSGRLHLPLDCAPDRADQPREPAPVEFELGTGADYRLQAAQLDRGIGQSEAHVRLVRALSFRA